MTNAFIWAIDNSIVQEGDYLYEHVDKTCTVDYSKGVMKVKNAYSVRQDKDSIREVVGTIGPISVAVNAGSKGW